MIQLDRIIRKVIAQFPKPLSLDEITRIVETELTQSLRDRLTLSPDLVLQRRIRRRVRAILRHDDRRLMLPGLQDHYSTKDRDIWPSREEMGLETALWNLERIEERRRIAEAEIIALTELILAQFPDALPQIQKRLGRHPLPNVTRERS